MELNLKRKDWNVMCAYLNEHAPFEACGLLAGKNNRVERILLIQNQAKSRVRFRMNPKEQLKAFDWIESNGLDLIGIFHSHPSGPETVSATDIEEATYAVPQIIWSRKNGAWMARGFWIDSMQVVEVKINVMEDEQP